MGIATGVLEDRYGWLTPVPKATRTETRTRGKLTRERADNMSAAPI
jgi:hypothetical protein